MVRLLEYLQQLMVSYTFQKFHGKELHNVEDVLKEGQEIEVELIDIDDRSGKLKLSRKVLLPKPEKK